MPILGELRDVLLRNSLEIQHGEVVVVAAMRNEAELLQAFLKHYRRLGAQRFILIDNGSQDASLAIAEQESDVLIIHTRESYRASRAGLEWTTAICRSFLVGHWVLTLDIDEFLMLPPKYRGLQDLLRFMDAEGATAFFCILLDVYPEHYNGSCRSDAEADFDGLINSGKWMFDSDSYFLRRAKHWPPIAVVGGPRKRVFFPDRKPSSAGGPSARKVPLVKWGPRTRYLFSTHALAPERLHVETGVLIHYKLRGGFSDRSRAELLRGDRTRDDHYRRYTARGADFLYSGSVPLRDAGDLVGRGFMIQCGSGLGRVPQRGLDELPLPLGQFPSIWKAAVSDKPKGSQTRSVHSVERAMRLRSKIARIVRGWKKRLPGQSF